jgi:predicted nucleic-acid-binding Zn-ribbon protein
MLEISTCPKCQSTKRVPNVRFIDRGDSNSTHDAALEIARHPEALIFRGSQRFALEANVCGECGYVELFVQDPQALWAAYEEQKANG